MHPFRVGLHPDCLSRTRPRRPPHPHPSRARTAARSAVRRDGASASESGSSSLLAPKPSRLVTAPRPLPSVRIAPARHRAPQRQPLHTHVSRSMDTSVTTWPCRGRARRPCPRWSRTPPAARPTPARSTAQTPLAPPCRRRQFQGAGAGNPPAPAAARRSDFSRQGYDGRPAPAPAAARSSAQGAYRPALQQTGPPTCRTNSPGAKRVQREQPTVNIQGMNPNWRQRATRSKPIRAGHPPGGLKERTCESRPDPSLKPSAASLALLDATNVTSAGCAGSGQREDSAVGSERIAPWAARG